MNLPHILLEFFWHANAKLMMFCFETPNFMAQRLIMFMIFHDGNTGTSLQSFVTEFLVALKSVLIIHNHFLSIRRLNSFIFRPA